MATPPVPDNLYPYSTAKSITADVEALRATYKSRATRPLAKRRELLLQLRKMLRENTDAITDALAKDLHKHRMEARLADIGVVDFELQEALDHLEDWAKPQKVSTNLPNLPGKSFIQPEPLGVVCIIGTWNFPVQLTLAPLVGALAAGNCALLRLPGSDTCVHTNNVLIRLLDEYMDKQFVRYVHGGVEESKVMLEQRFDLIFCTGGSFIGKIVATAAAKHLTPTILELGGKSPAIIDETCDLDVTARRLTATALMNAGQTCVRPDYVLVSAKIGDQLVAKMEQNIRDFFGEDEQKSNSMARLVNARAFERVSGLLQKDVKHISFGGAFDAGDRYISPTILNFERDFDSFKNSAVMSQEIFGPVIPVYYYESLDEAIEYVNDGEKPLALYVYTSNAKNRTRVLDETSSGGVCVNDSVMQLTNPHLPFGGVGQSGMGVYHGKYSFEAFSHRKSVLVRSTWLDLKIRYYPFTPESEKALEGALKPISRRTKRMFKMFGYAVGVVALAVVVKFAWPLIPAIAAAF